MPVQPACQPGTTGLPHARCPSSQTLASALVDKAVQPLFPGSTRFTGTTGGPPDEDISANVTPTSPPSTYIGPVTRARARQLNYQVLSFLANPSNVHEHMML